MNNMLKPLLIIVVTLSLSHFYASADTSDVIPDGWGKSGSNPEHYVVGIDTQTSMKGEKSSFISSKPNVENGFGTLTQKASAEEYLAQRVKMTIAIKSQGVNERAAAWFRVDSQTGEEIKTVSMDNMRNRPIEGSTNWTEYSLVLDIPSEASNIVYGVLLKGEGKVWFDDVRFEIVDLATSLTATYFDNQGKHRPRNLSFENDE